MNAQALLGLAGLNALYLVGGAALVWGVRGWATWRELGRLAGLAYLCGVAATGSLLVLALVAGVPFSAWTVLGAVALPLAAGVALGRRAGRRLARPAALRAGRGALVAAAGVAVAGVLLEGLFRAARLSGLYAWDAWSFWVPKAKAIYFFGGLDRPLFEALPGSAYPPLLPALDAAAFHALGNVDVVTLHVQFWLFAVGFVAAAAGLLSERVPPWLLWPFVVLVLALPRTGTHLVTPQADFLLDFLFVAAVLLVLGWLEEGARWQLVLAAVLLCGCVLLKREGLLLAGCLVAAAALASAPRARRAWPPLAALGATCVLALVPWRLWLAANDVASNTGGIEAGTEGGRAGPALRLSVEVFFEDGLWSVAPTLAVGAVALALLARRWREGVFTASLLVLLLLGGAAITWGVADLPITADESVNPIVRYTAAATLAATLLTPLLLAGAWRAGAPAEEPA